RCAGPFSRPVALLRTGDETDDQAAALVVVVLLRLRGRPLRLVVRAELGCVDRPGVGDGPGPGPFVPAVRAGQPPGQAPLVLTGPAQLPEGDLDGLSALCGYRTASPGLSVLHAAPAPGDAQQSGSYAFLVRSPEPLHLGLVVVVDPVDRDHPLRVTAFLRLLVAQRVPPGHG
ncbi:hypothetical protein, partial [Streptomyces sp. MBT51]|uniref:hypothetical protein n=1 Tax=Streptomyces sp. MBT51 TaxID=2800408 RepID=UPI001F3E2E58